MRARRSLPRARAVVLAACLSFALGCGSSRPAYECNYDFQCAPREICSSHVCRSTLDASTGDAGADAATRDAP